MTLFHFFLLPVYTIETFVKIRLWNALKYFSSQHKVAQIIMPQEVLKKEVSLCLLQQCPGKKK